MSRLPLQKDLAQALEVLPENDRADGQMLLGRWKDEWDLLGALERKAKSTAAASRSSKSQASASDSESDTLTIGSAWSGSSST